MINRDGLSNEGEEYGGESEYKAPDAELRRAALDASEILVNFLRGETAVDQADAVAAAHEISSYVEGIHEPGSISADFSELIAALRSAEIDFETIVGPSLTRLRDTLDRA